MTKAICIWCGNDKANFRQACPSCKRKPSSREELVKSFRCSEGFFREVGHPSGGSLQDFLSQARITITSGREFASSELTRIDRKVALMKNATLRMLVFGIAAFLFGAAMIAVSVFLIIHS